MNHLSNALLIVVAILAAGVTVLLLPARKPVYVQAEELEAPVPLEQWTRPDAGALVSRLVVGKLKTHPGQKTADCDADLGEQERQGACWMKTEVPPPCPAGKLQEDEGKCWRPVPKTSRSPTSGELVPLGIAEP